jgi:hypothetical protein
MRTPLLVLALLLAGALAAEPALAQKRDNKDKVTEDEDAAGKGSAEDAAGIMRQPLPFKEVQTLRYYGPNRELQGWAERRHHSIRFFDAKGQFIGRAERVSQRLTLYYAPDGSLIGRRVQQKMTVANTATYQPPNKGFLEPVGPPQEAPQ